MIFSNKLEIAKKNCLNIFLILHISNNMCKMKKINKLKKKNVSQMIQNCPILREMAK